jgi:hypothetical protein
MLDYPKDTMVLKQTMKRSMQQKHLNTHDPGGE